MLLDISGYYADAAPGGLWLRPLPAPVRLIDTRAGTEGQAEYAAIGPITANEVSRNMQARGITADARAISVTAAMLADAGNGMASEHAVIIM